MLSKAGDHQDAPETYSLMRRALDLLPDGVLIIGGDREVLYTNAAFKSLWRIPPDVVRQGDRAMLGHVLDQLDDPRTFSDLVEALYPSPAPSDDEIIFNDGRVYDRRSVAFEGGDGGFSRIWVFSDVTEAWSARVDQLTGLLNRRAYARELPVFMETLSPETVKSFALLDVDHFKRYNDIYGHAAGDAVLERLGTAFRAFVPAGSGQIFRIGGEEFAITSTHLDAASAKTFHETIADAVRDLKISHVGNDRHGLVTVSMGVAFFKGVADPKDVFGLVDRALYSAKDAGRNRVEFAAIPDITTRSIARVDRRGNGERRRACGVHPIDDASAVTGRVSSSPIVYQPHTSPTLGINPQSLFNALTQSVPGSVWLADRLGVGKFFNEAWLSLTGLSLTESLDRGWAAAVHPMDGDKVVPSTAASDHVVTSQARIRIRRADGVYRWHLVRSTPAEGGSGLWISCAIDVHEQVVDKQKSQSQITILNMVASDAPLQAVLESLCRLGEEQLPGSRCTVLVLNEQGTEFEAGAADFLPAYMRAMIPGTRIGPAVGSCGTAAYERRDIISADILNDPMWLEWRHLFKPLGVRACWSRPVFGTKGEVLATLGFYFFEPRAPSEDELQSLDNLRYLASLSIGRARTSQALRESEDHYRYTVEHNPQVPWTADPSGNILSVSSKWTDLTGMSVEHALGDGWQKALHPDDAERTLAYWREKLLTGEQVDVKYRIRLRDGEYRWVRGRAMARRDKGGNVLRWYGAAEDIHDLELATERLQRQLNLDDLTRLLNRRALEDHLRARLSDTPPARGSVAMLTVDIAGFKHVNDRFGHETGDAVLRLLGRYLRGCLNASDTVARVAGDEFAVVLARSIDGPQLQKRATTIAISVNRRLERNAKTRNCTIRIGCATSEPREKTEDFLRRTKLALYAAKREANCSIKLYTPAIRRTVDERAEQIELAKDALDHDWILPFYQPTISLRTGAICSAEALLRIAHPKRGTLAPASLWAALDAPKLGKAISERMLTAVLTDLANWAPDFATPQSVSINLSTETISQQGFARQLLKSMARIGVSPHQITVEITERVLIGDLAAHSLQGLLELQRNGVRVSLDDFGTGFASLTHLQTLPINEIKIDRSFVSNLAAGGPNAAIVRSMIALGANMDVDVIAEGVETSDQARMLREWGCRFAQGYYFHKPMPAAEFSKLIVHKILAESEP